MNLQKGGYIQGAMHLIGAIEQLEIHIETFPQKLKQFSSEELLKRPAPGKWSRQEILGHLIDSAINNLKRFTEVQFLAQPYTVISYRQNELIIVNDYQNLPLQHLLDLWKILNQQIVLVVKRIPPDKLKYTVDPQYESSEMKTLEWIICDYVAHMEHHFRQIFPVSN